jgi:hypothetical protein
MNFLNWLKKPYFFNSSLKSQISIALGIGFFIFIFLYLFLPFGMSDLKGNIFFYCLGFGFVTFFTQTFIFGIIPLIFKDFFKNENWTIGKNILLLFILITAISFFNWLYNSQVQNTENWRLLTLKEIYIYTFTISIFPIFIFTYLSEKFYSIQRQSVSKKIMDTRVTDKTIKIDETVTLYAENNKDTITFNLNKLVYITSQKNYASFYLKTENGLKERILRNSLLQIIKQLKDFKNIKRCHKSYIIHTKFMDSIYGNARGYYLKSKFLDKEIPISRSFKKEEIKEFIQ